MIDFLNKNYNYLLILHFYKNYYLKQNKKKMDIDIYNLKKDK